MKIGYESLNDYSSRIVKNKMVLLSNHLLPSYVFQKAFILFGKFYIIILLFGKLYIICTKSSDLPKHLRCILSLSFSQVILLETLLRWK